MNLLKGLWTNPIVKTTIVAALGGGASSILDSLSHNAPIADTLHAAAAGAIIAAIGLWFRKPGDPPNPKTP